MQMRDLTSLGKKYGVKPYIPFDHPSVMKETFKTPNKFRKLNKWNKQVIRDVFSPYVSEKMKKGKVGSLIIPYNKLLIEKKDKFIKYLRSSEIINNIVDLDIYEKEFEKLPEPGLNLKRLVNLAVWYDINWDKNNLENFEKIF